MNTSLYVGYEYDQSATGGVLSHNLRLKHVRYPNGRLVHYAYDGAINDALSRVAAINADNNGNPGDELALYSYNGRGRIVIEQYPQPDVELD